MLTRPSAGRLHQPRVEYCPDPQRALCDTAARPAFTIQYRSACSATDPGGAVTVTVDFVSAHLADGSRSRADPIPRDL